ncbi:S8 family serine peptidase [Clostridioides sp. ES-S-0054-01]|uniref:S8 family peptidase n=2 Tax=Clostridioides TaxID=1870884 RepID=UPI001E0FC72C|nr:S8 family serine peptidase [Clostridioides sp. ES-S-0171-01]MCC0688277.1 S8 family serine peptidase [Clostridioides sp. ES-S-0056-01]MCC0715812.1 S8 family serine peptidase [Clostridioides sp. ES-S-0077-01]UDN54355.1 S8 family serine peptidase [Clostridioides sp. ES-S-0054-01]
MENVCDMNNKVKVAVLDTGIDKNHDYLKDNLVGGIAFECIHDYIFISDKFDDEDGHGTACASIIKKEYEDVELFVIKVLGKDGITNIKVLEEALRYLLDTNIRLINLSLSVIGVESVKGLFEVCYELFRKGKIIVCSLANDFDLSYPAMFNNVIGVRGFTLDVDDSFWYNKKYDVQCVMDSNSYISCDINNSYRLPPKCNSYLSAKLTGKIAKILSEKPDTTISDLNDKLESLATRNHWNSCDFDEYSGILNFKLDLYDKDNALLMRVADVVRDCLNIEDDDKKLFQCSLFNKEIGLVYDNCFNLLKKLEHRFDIKFNYMDISKYDLVSIYTLTGLVERYKSKNL